MPFRWPFRWHHMMTESFRLQTRNRHFLPPSLMTSNVIITRLCLIAATLFTVSAIPISDERISTGSDLLQGLGVPGVANIQEEPVEDAIEEPPEPPSETMFLEKIDEVEYVGNTINGGQWIKAGECSSAQQGRINKVSFA